MGVHAEEKSVVARLLVLKVMADIPPMSPELVIPGIPVALAMLGDALVMVVRQWSKGDQK